MIKYLEQLKKHFTKRRVIPFIISFILTIIAFIVVIIKSFFPYHIYLGLSIYLLSWVGYIFPFISYLRKSVHGKNIKIKHFKKYIISITSILTFLILFYFIITLFPITNVKIVKDDIPLLENKLEKDTIYLTETLTSLDSSYNELIDSGLLNIEITDATPEKINELKALFAKVVDHIIILDQLTEEYKYFYQINYLKYPELNIKAFVIGYTSYIYKYKTTLDIAKKIGNNNFVEIQLNEVLPGLGISKTYMILKNKLYYPSTSIKINTGSQYLEYAKRRHKVDNQISELIERDLDIYYSFLWEIRSTSKIKLDGIFDTFEINTMEQWLPVQKRISSVIGDTEFKPNQNSMISIEEIQKLKLEPGDIIFQRRNWHMSNIGMPGFWTHAAIYLGTLDVLDEYFKQEAEELFGIDVSEYLKINYPKFYEDKLRVSEKGYNYTTIEGKAEGIIMLPLEVSANSDYLAVIRPKLSKKDKLKALTYTFDNYLKPYDYNFDFSTEDTLVCSELVYKAYIPSTDKEGLSYDLEKLAGRWILAPNDMVRAFDMNFGTSKEQNEFILFIDSYLDSDIIEYKGLEEFRESWKRPKYELMLE